MKMHNSVVPAKITMCLNRMYTCYNYYVCGGWRGGGVLFTIFDGAVALSDLLLSVPNCRWMVSMRNVYTWCSVLFALVRED